MVHRKQAEKDVDASRDLPDEDIKSASPYLLTKAARLQSALYRSRTMRLEVNPAAAYILYELTRQEPLTPKDLSERLSLGPAAIGQTLTRMERDGMITRDRTGINRRWVQVRLTERGRSAVPKLSSEAANLTAEIVQALGADGERDFVNKLEILIDHLARKVEIEGALTYAKASSNSGTEV